MTTTRRRARTKTWKTVANWPGWRIWIAFWAFIGGLAGLEVLSRVGETRGAIANVTHISTGQERMMFILDTLRIEGRINSLKIRKIEEILGVVDE